MTCKITAEYLTQYIKNSAKKFERVLDKASMN